jgi:hypothetical protein
MPLIKVIKEGFDKEYDYYRVRKQDAERYKLLHNKLFEYAVIKKKPAPAKMLAEFLLLQEDVYYENKDIHDKKEKEIIDKVLEYFKNKPDYKFSVKLYDWWIDSDTIYDFERLVKVVVIHLVRNHYYQMNGNTEDKYNNKENVIRDAFIRIDSFLKGIHKYKPYQKAILAGYITICFGYTLIDPRKKTTNPNIFQATRYALSGLLKEKPATKKSRASER